MSSPVRRGADGKGRSRLPVTADAYGLTNPGIRRNLASRLPYEVRLVASIEILSLSNKSPGNPGREQFLTKQKEILGGPVHLVEIDLLRGGTHTTAVPRELIEAKVGPFDYHVSVHRFDRPTAFLVYPLSMRLRLPPLAIPLLPGDPDVTVDLQAVFDRAYDAGPYRREVDYGGDPVIPPFRPDQAKWVASQLIRSQ